MGNLNLGQLTLQVLLETLLVLPGIVAGMGGPSLQLVQRNVVAGIETIVPVQFAVYAQAQLFVELLLGQVAEFVNPVVDGLGTRPL